jgi:hypothetical protein
MNKHAKNPLFTRLLYIVGIIVLVAIVLVHSYLTYPKGHLSTWMEADSKRVAHAIHQYNVAKQTGSSKDAFIAAGAVVKAYQHAKDTSNCRKWKEIEEEEAKLAGVNKVNPY